MAIAAIAVAGLTAPAGPLRLRERSLRRLPIRGLVLGHPRLDRIVFRRNFFQFRWHLGQIGAPRYSSPSTRKT